VKEDHNLVANGRRRKSFQCLMANGRRRRSSPMFNGQSKEKEKLPNAWWLMEGKGEAPFHLFSFSP